ncbi:MAG: hypothetical protein LUG18_00525 [Candidatus Azobacteroides sp.]|nr:hypothetical protein [Candidatus Azobacteroides sp.]
MKIKRIKIPLMLIFLFMGNMFLFIQAQTSPIPELFNEGKNQERTLSGKSGSMEQKNVFNENNSFSSSSDEEGILKAAPPELGGDNGDYSPGGQVNPQAVPIHDGYLFMGLLVLLYVNIRFIYKKRKK